MVLRKVTIRGHTALVCNQPLGSTLTETGNKYGPKDSSLRQKGNRRSGIALAMHYRLRDISTYRLNGIRKGDEHPAYVPIRSTAPFTFLFY